jgi:DedD protein
MDPILQQEEQRRLRTQLIWRLGFAVMLIVGVLGVMIWLDRERESGQSGPEASLPMRIAPPVEIASEAASAPQASEPAIEPASPVAEASTPAASVPETLAPTPTATPLPTIAASKAATPAPSMAAAPRSRATATPAINREIAIPTRPVIVLPQKPAVGEPVRAAPPMRPSTPANPPVSASQFTVQAGNFLHASNAEKLLRQLQEAGIPAYLETRVQIGPFASKSEADAAMARLRKMGINPVLNPAR